MTDQWSDKIFDSLLEEMLTNQHPPDLTEQIQQRLREERALTQREQAQRAHAPVAPARVALERSSVSSDVASSSTSALPSRNGRSHSAPSDWPKIAIAALTLAAALLLAVGAWRFWPVHNTDNEAGLSSTASSDNASSVNASSGNASSGITAELDEPSARERALAANSTPANEAPQRDDGAASGQATAPRAASDLAAHQPTAGGHSAHAQPASAQPGASPAPVGEMLSLDHLPFSADETKPAFASAANRVVAEPVEARSDEEVVAWLDERFNALWARKQVQPEERLAADAEAARVAVVLTGGALPPSNAPPRELADTLLRSASFAEHWADRLVAYWLRGTPAADKTNKAGAALRTAVAQQIVARKPWNEIVAGLIDSQPGEPESAFLAVLAGGGNHRLAGRVGSAVLDEALGCARCHDASDNGRLITTDQDEYWSLIAIFNGIDSRDTSKTAPKDPSGKQPVRKELVDRQTQLFADGKSPNVFFDRPDGRLQAAEYRLPGGDNWRSVRGASTPRESLARWIASTSVTDHAAVNTAWRLVYGRPLVAQHAALDGEGWAERREMLDELAKQFQAHGRDISKLVGWLISSEPFRTQTLGVDRQKWLLATEEEIDRWNYADVNFASFKPRSPNAQKLASLEGALASVVRWSSTRDERIATLAQPGPIQGSTKPKPQAVQPPSASQSADPPATYLVRSLQPTAAQSELIKRLVASKLTWPEQVEHIAGLVGESGKNGKLQKTADQLLELKNGDRSAALFQLLQSALLCEEAL